MENSGVWVRHTQTTKKVDTWRTQSRICQILAFHRLKVIFQGSVGFSTMHCPLALLMCLGANTRNVSESSWNMPVREATKHAAPLKNPEELIWDDCRRSLCKTCYRLTARTVTFCWNLDRRILNNAFVVKQFWLYTMDSQLGIEELYDPACICDNMLIR